MAKIHSYGVDNQPFRLTILSWMAFFTFVTVLLADSLRKGSFDLLSFLKTYLPFASLFTITFLILHLVYDQFIWKINRFDKVPNLSGTWIGMGDNPSVEHLRLELMQIEQNWSKIFITVKVYEGNDDDPNFDATNVLSWLDDTTNMLKVDCMGTESSTIALITEYDSAYCNLIFNYKHDAEAQSQDSFKGAMFLKYEKTPEDGVTPELHELTGNYINDKERKDSEGKKIKGLVGTVQFLRVSPQLIETKKALRNVKDKSVLARLHRKVTA
jgi:hypothetical protein